MNKYRKNLGFQKQGFWKKRSLGQNFLTNSRIINRIVSASYINKNDTIIEVGPGTGNLTKELLKKARQVIVIEKDKRLIPTLKKGFENICNIQIIEGDALNYSWSVPEALLLEKGYKIVANIPYYITSNFLRTVFERWPRSELIVLMVQKEVAQRIMAKPPHMNLLALSVQYYSEPEIMGYVSKNNFRPIPKVDSAIIRLIPRFPEARLLENKVFTDFPEALLLESGLMRFGFSEKRKQLAGVLSKKLKISKNEVGEALQRINLSRNARAENLSLEQWKYLKNYLNI